IDEVSAEHLGQTAERRAPPQVHLEQAVLRLDESLREKQIVPGLRVDVRDAPPIADDAHRRREADDLDHARDLRDEWRRLRTPASAADDTEMRENTEKHEHGDTETERRPGSAAARSPPGRRR